MKHRRRPRQSNPSSRQLLLCLENKRTCSHTKVSPIAALALLPIAALALACCFLTGAPVSSPPPFLQDQQRSLSPEAALSIGNTCLSCNGPVRGGGSDLYGEQGFPRSHSRMGSPALPEMPNWHSSHSTEVRVRHAPTWLEAHLNAHKSPKETQQPGRPMCEGCACMQRIGLIVRSI